MSTANYHIFYNDNKTIEWATTAGMDAAMITAQTDLGLNYVQKAVVNLPDPNEYYMSDDIEVTAKSLFDPTYSTLIPNLDATVNITGVPAGTEVFLDDVSAGTMSDTTLTLTATEPGKFVVKLTKHGYKDHRTTLSVQRVAT